MKSPGKLYEAIFFVGIIGLVLISKANAQNNLFFRNLKLGDAGSDVLALQKELNRSPLTQVASSGPGAPGEETDFYGQKTAAAVKRYQEMWRNEILAPVGLSNGTGFFGESTRKHMASQSSVAPVPEKKPNIPPVTAAPSKPVITSVSPSHAMEGAEITLTGTGFLPTNTVYASFAKLENIPSLDGKTIKFTVKEPFPDDLEVPAFIREKYKSMQYGFYISNKNGASNTVMFTLDLIKQ